MNFTSDLVNMSFIFKCLFFCRLLRSEEEIVNCLMLKTVSMPAYEFIRQNQVTKNKGKLSEWTDIKCFFGSIYAFSSSSFVQMLIIIFLNSCFNWNLQMFPIPSISTLQKFSHLSQKYRITQRWLKLLHLDIQYSNHYLCFHSTYMWVTFQSMVEQRGF